MRNYKGTNGYLSSSHERRLLNLGINQSRFARRKEKKKRETERKVKKRLYFLPFRRNLFYKETATTVGLDLWTEI